jgi:hypothetical protein
VVLGLRLLLGDVPAGARLAVLVVAGAAVYVGGALLLDRTWLRGLWQLLRHPPDAVPVGAA